MTSTARDTLRSLCLSALLRGVQLAAITLLLLANTAVRAGTRDLATAPDWTLRNLGGETIRLADFRGKIVVLNFWASWCLPCRKEIPNLVELHEKYADRGLVVVGISLDDEAQLVRSAVKTLNVSYPVVMGNPAVASAYGNVSVLPSTFVINKEGKIVAVHEGLADASVVEKEIKSLL